MSDREALAIPSFDDDLDDFAPRGAGQGGLAAAPAPASQGLSTRRAVDAVSRFPSREGPNEGQLNVKGPRPVLDRFKALCKADRRSYYDMLEILMDSFETKGQGPGL